jgi:hypothetical protein
MRTNHFSRKKNFLLPLVIASFTFFSLLSCKGKKENLAGMDVSCAVLLQQKMKDAWETPGYLKSIDYFTFYSGYNRGTGKFSVGVQAFKKDFTKIGSYVDLTHGTGCNVSLPGGVAIGDNNIALADLGILKDPGTLKEFDYLKLTPKPFPENDSFMNFDLEIVTGGVGSQVAKSTLPCPPCPYCNPPCAAEKRIDPLMNSKDSTGQKAP